MARAATRSTKPSSNGRSKLDPLDKIRGLDIIINHSTGNWPFRPYAAHSQVLGHQFLVGFKALASTRHGTVLTSLRSFDYWLSDLGTHTMHRASRPWYVTWALPGPVRIAFFAMYTLEGSIDISRIKALMC